MSSAEPTSPSPMSTPPVSSAPPSPATATVSVRPVVLPAPGRGEDLQLRVTGPMAGEHLPVIAFSHGFGSYGTVPMTVAENPALLALVRQLSTAYLRTALGVDETSLPAARDALFGQADPAGRLESS